MFIYRFRCHLFFCFVLWKCVGARPELCPASTIPHSSDIQTIFSSTPSSVYFKVVLKMSKKSLKFDLFKRTESPGRRVRRQRGQLLSLFLYSKDKECDKALSLETCFMTQRVGTCVVAGLAAVMCVILDCECSCQYTLSNRLLSISLQLEKDQSIQLKQTFRFKQTLEDLGHPCLYLFQT